MALYKYFTREPSVLPNPDGVLSKHVPPSAIRQANKEVHMIKEENQAAAKKTRLPYSVSVHGKREGHHPKAASC